MKGWCISCCVLGHTLNQCNTHLCRLAEAQDVLMRLEQIGNSVGHLNTHSANFALNANNLSEPKREKKVKSSKPSINHTGYFTMTLPEEPRSVHKDRYKFLIDTGLNVNICSEQLLFSDFHPCSNHTVMVGRNNILHAQGIGMVKALNTVDGKDICVQLNNTLFMPSFSMNIISISHFIKDFSQSHSFSRHGGQFVVYHHSCGKATPILHAGECGPSDYITVLQCLCGWNAITYAAVATTDKLLKDHIQLNHCSMSML